MIADRLLGFCDALRKNGVRAAEQEVIDSFRAVEALGADALRDRDTFLCALSSTLAKSAAEEEILSRVFDLHFGFALDAGPVRGLAELLADRGVAPDAVDAILRSLDDEDALVRALIDGDAEGLTELVRAGLEDLDLDGLQSSLQIAYFTSRLMQRLGHAGLEERLLRGRVALGSMPPDSDRALASATWDLGERLRRTARRAIERELEKRTVSKPAQRGSLLDRDLRAVNPGEIEELRVLVRRLAEKLRQRLVVRRRRARRGRLDVRRVLRTSIATDGVPTKLALLRKRPHKPEVFILCDVSDSVRQASLFMLELVGALADVLRRARAWVFVDRVGEVTQLFAPAGSGGAHRVDAAIQSILDGNVIPVSANSDYGRALRGFFDACGGALTRKTTVVILGDGRSNYRPPEDWVLAEIRRRSRRLLWLCPEDRPTWGFGDSEMHRYARHADAIFVVRSAADLARAIDRVAR